MIKALEISAENFEKEVINSDIPVLVDFWAPWCGPCQMMAPVLDGLAQDLEGKIKIVKIDVDNSANQILAGTYEIMSIPNMKLFKNGKIINEFVGFRSKEELKKELELKL